VPLAPPVIATPELNRSDKTWASAATNKKEQNKYSGFCVGENAGDKEVNQQSAQDPINVSTRKF
jgi:hypothetical protein